MFRTATSVCTGREERRESIELARKIAGCGIELNPQYIMTNDTYVFYNAFKAVFPSSRAAQMLCSSHIRQALQRKHKELLKDSDVRTGKRFLSSLLIETDARVFENKYSAFMTWLSSIGSMEMLTHVEKKYSRRKRE
ncbi:hypothetical protein RB195_023317 [Necator americanus]|uniref:MULE transposase domain-containing protein n=1 Tax=Necator americanus TaxID=51031 RepID=A0ABR1EIM8_NECAM